MGVGFGPLLACLLYFLLHGEEIPFSPFLKTLVHDVLFSFRWAMGLNLSYSLPPLVATAGFARLQSADYWF